MEKPLISFIITYYNLPVTMLRECIDSILSLSLNPSEREVIIVDDGSANSPVNELNDTYGSDIIYIRQSNKGLSKARNTGIRLATGHYLQFIDSDDYLLKTPYDHCISLIRTGQPEMVVFNFANSVSESRPIHDNKPMSGSDYLRNHNIHGSACGYLFSRNILGELRFTPGIWHEDEEFTPLLLLRAEHICVTDAPAYYYRNRSDSITTGSQIRQKLKRLHDTRDIIFRLNTIADRLPAKDKSALQRRVSQLTMDYLYHIIRQTGSRHYLERKLMELRKVGLFPLPDHRYTAKYTWFRRLSNSPTGISILMRIIPLISQER